ncbi:hypothetical protein GLAREA_09030 [Glarea lozoyensis ATCC 20868]|uniref:Uncharacterized protein n=1 Tax=Glarea lozoyensis (strain ATCC 20868 / MF5171) TaxID=1116229 RepID=S3DEP3_GLAL2|nr:uncharacterized protein GLAREA_09030 [Glarea lozoyensis ATCC 20868]EPE36867.1 hypothetical protein GLAREA_09030 [Glarea lozoyensis ATCC 20868]
MSLFRSQLPDNREAAFELQPLKFDSSDAANSSSSNDLDIIRGRQHVHQATRPPSLDITEGQSSRIEISSLEAPIPIKPRSVSQSLITVSRALPGTPQSTKALGIIRCPAPGNSAQTSAKFALSKVLEKDKTMTQITQSESEALWGYPQYPLPALAVAYQQPYASQPPFPGPPGQHFQPQYSPSQQYPAPQTFSPGFQQPGQGFPGGPPQLFGASPPPGPYIPYFGPESHTPPAHGTLPNFLWPFTLPRSLVRQTSRTSFGAPVVPPYQMQQLHQGQPTSFQGQQSNWQGSMESQARRASLKGKHNHKLILRRSKGQRNVRDHGSHRDQDAGSMCYKPYEEHAQMGAPSQYAPPQGVLPIPHPTDYILYFLPSTHHSQQIPGGVMGGSFAQIRLLDNFVSLVSPRFLIQISIGVPKIKRELSICQSFKR